MPPVNWGIASDSVDDFDPNDRYSPYMGPTDIAPGMYVWRIAVMKRTPRTKDKMPQLRVGLELVPRKGNKYESKYKGYFAMDFIPVSDKTSFRYAPLLSVLGVSGMDFTKRTRVDDEGNILAIGKWKMNGKTLIAAQLIDGKDMDGNARKEIRGGAYFEVPEDLSDEDFDDTDFEDDEDEIYDGEDEEEEYDEDDDDADEEEEERPRASRRGKVTRTPAQRRAGTKKATSSAARRRAPRRSR